MYIKYITVQGFKSYRDPVKTDQLSSHHNIVVGRNGSGKSNFFAAITFVLSEEFGRLSPEQRQSLIYEGAGAGRIMSAFVEIIFDNSDKRLLISEKNEVALRRTIGSKKDQFFLDGKVVTRSEVMNLLESAGFSRSNPYYIVRQGKINEIAIAKESHRLKLLKEVAGTRIYDERKEESKTLMDEAETKIQNATDLLNLIDEKLKTLEQEKAELIEYQKLDKQKKALEYSITTTELNDINKKLNDLEKKRNDEDGNSSKYRHDRYEAEVAARQYETELFEHNRKLTQLVEEEKQCQKEKTGIVRKKQRLELKLRDFYNQQEIDQENRDSTNTELQQLQQKIEQDTNKLQDLIPKFDIAKEQELQISNLVNAQTASRNEINARRGRKTLFNTREERDLYLTKQLNSIENEILNKTDEISYCNQTLNNIEKSLTQINDNYDKICFEKIQHQQNWQTAHNELTSLKRGREEHYSNSHEIVRKENAVYNKIETHKQAMSNKQHRLNQIIGKSTYNAIRSLETVQNHFRKLNKQDLVSGYYGMAIDYINCSEEFYTCVEAAAGSKLFNFIMKDVKTGKAYIKEMNKQNLPGTPQIIPLTSLSDHDYRYPEVTDETGELTAFPLVERLDVSRPDFLPVAKHLVGRYMVTVDTTWSSRIANEYNLSCVTLGGDTTSARGVISGGYRDLSKSRLRLYQEIHRFDDEKLENLKTEMFKLQEEKKNLENNTHKFHENVGNKEAEIKKQRDLIDRCVNQESLIKADQKNKKTNLDNNKKAILHLKESIVMLKSQANTMNQELGREFSNAEHNLSQKENQDLQDLNQKIETNTKKLQQLQDNRRNLEREKNTMENHLYNNLYKRREQLINETDDISIAERKQQLKACQTDLETSSKELEYVETRLYDLLSELEIARTEESNLKTKFDEYSNKEKEMSQKLDEDQKKLVKIITKQQTASQRKDELEKKIIEIGPVAQDIVAKFRSVSTKSLYESLHKANTSLQKYSSINKKALDQYMTSSDERKILQERKDECEKGKIAIEEMMQVLEEKKYNQIMFTFQQVSKYFKDVFSKLVSNGHAELVMQVSEVGDDDVVTSQVDKFTGVSIRVSFNGGAETKEMNQLSGGQKSLVALTLIFAIQKCDPAPFYLFDEIDAALDPGYRKQVSQIISELSEHAQFISTTFRPELLDSGDMFHGVLYKNKVSDIRTITKQQAMEFVEDDAVHG